MVKIDVGMHLIQRKYVLDLLRKYGMLGCKPLQLPLDTNAKYHLDVGNKIQNVQMYRSIVGSLLYATITRPYITYTTG